MRAESIERLHDSRDKHGEGEDDNDVDGRKHVADGGVPAEGVVGAEDALCLEEIYDKDEENAGCNEDLGGDGKADVGGERDRGDTDGTSCYTGHTEAEYHAVEQKLVSSALVVLENCHVCRCANDI